MYRVERDPLKWAHSSGVMGVLSGLDMRQPLKVTIGTLYDLAFRAFSLNGETPSRMAFVKLTIFLENCIVGEGGYDSECAINGNWQTGRSKRYLGNSGFR